MIRALNCFANSMPTVKKPSSSTSCLRKSWSYPKPGNGFWKTARQAKNGSSISMRRTRDIVNGSKPSVIG